jgi:tetratricopeptide (TPR) repeat protein
VAAHSQTAADFARAASFLDRGELQEAEQAVRALLAADDRHVDGWHLLGLALSRQARYREAAEALRTALRHRPDPAIYNNLGETLRLQDGPQSLQDAAGCYERAIELRPSFPEAHYNLANLLRRLGDYERAILLYRKAVALRPAYDRAWYNLGNACAATGRTDQAIDAYRQSLSIRADQPDVLINLGNCLYDARQLPAALAAYQRAAELRPDDAELLVAIGHVHSASGRTDEAAAAYQRYWSHHTDRPLAALRAAIQVPPILSDRAEIRHIRDRILESLDRLVTPGICIAPSELHSSGVEPPMLLAYHGEDDLPLYHRYAQALITAMPTPPEPPEPQLKPVPKVGIVVTRGHEGVFIKCMGRLVDALAAAADDLQVVVCCGLASVGYLKSQLASTRLQWLLLPGRVDEAAEALRSGRFAALIYWEIGTDSTNWFLPMLRPARVQVNTWGWPVSSGQPYVTHYLTGTRLDPAGADRYYSERLIRLQSLPTIYTRPRVPDEFATPQGRARARRSFGLQPGHRVYVCVQNLRKYHPDFDELIAGILRNDRQGRFVLVGDEQRVLTEHLLGRFRRSMPDVVDRVGVLPRLPESGYYKLLAAADVVLDPPHYSGGANSAFDAVAAGAAVITMAGDRNRSRWTAAVYESLGLSQALATSPADYIQRAVSLANDQNGRSEFTSDLRSRAADVFDGERPASELADELLHISYFGHDCSTTFE